MMYYFECNADTKQEMISRLMKQIFLIEPDFIKKSFADYDAAQTGKSGQAEVLVMPNERELTEYYNNEENQEWLNASLGKQKASGAVAGQWQKEKPTKPCLFVHRYNYKDDKPGLQYAVMDCDILCVTDIELNEFVSTMENFADGEFFIIHFI